MRNFRGVPADLTTDWAEVLPADPNRKALIVHNKLASGQVVHLAFEDDAAYSLILAAGATFDFHQNAPQNAVWMKTAASTTTVSLLVA